MHDNLITNLTSKDDKYACAIADKIISESQNTDEWYGYFDTFASLLNHPKSLVRNRALHILAANAQWDDNNRFDAILSEYLSHMGVRTKSWTPYGLRKELNQHVFTRQN